MAVCQGFEGFFHRLHYGFDIGIPFFELTESLIHFVVQEGDRLHSGRVLGGLIFNQHCDAGDFAPELRKLGFGFTLSGGNMGGLLGVSGSAPLQN